MYSLWRFPSKQRAYEFFSGGHPRRFEVTLTERDFQPEGSLAALDTLMIILFIMFVTIVLGYQCSMSLGIEDGRIPDSALTASTIYSGSHATTFARLNLAAASGKAGSWRAKTNNVNQWLQIDLGTLTTVTKVATQGRQDHSEWITSYSLSYSLAGSFWVQYTMRGIKKVIIHVVLTTL